MEVLGHSEHTPVVRGFSSEWCGDSAANGAGKRRRKTGGGSAWGYVDWTGSKQDDCRPSLWGVAKVQS